MDSRELPPQRLPTKAGITDAVQPNRKPNTQGTKPNLPGWGGIGDDVPGSKNPGGLPGWPGGGSPDIPGGYGRGGYTPGGLPNGPGGSRTGVPDIPGAPWIPGEGGIGSKTPGVGNNPWNGEPGPDTGKGGRPSNPFGGGVGDRKGTGQSPVVKGPGNGTVADGDGSGADEAKNKKAPKGDVCIPGRDGKERCSPKDEEDKKKVRDIVDRILGKKKGGGSSFEPEGGGEEPGTPDDRRRELQRRIGYVPPPRSGDPRNPEVSDPVGADRAAAGEASGGANPTRGHRGPSAANGAPANPVNSQMKGAGGGKNPIDPDPNNPGGPNAKSGFYQRLLDALQVFVPVPH